ncbi:MAG: SagB/ThcOx family dehydrogenase [Desulfurococcaceae archaeon]
MRGPVELPSPPTQSPLGALLRSRRSIRRFAARPLEREKLSLVLWAAYGCTDARCRRRTSPSAGALYPLAVYASIREGGVEGLGAGVYEYLPREHALTMVVGEDRSHALYRACLGQRFVRDAPANIVLVGFRSRIVPWYGERGERYMILEAGHVGQNIYLAAAEAGLGTVAVGAFEDAEVLKAIGLGDGDAVALYVFPLGYPA